MSVDKFETVALPTDYESDESHLIAAGCNYNLGEDGGQRLVTFNLDDNKICIYEAVTGTHRYPPGRMMGVSLSAEEFEKMLTIYQARKVRQEQRAEVEKAAGKLVEKDDFDPFLDPDELP